MKILVVHNEYRQPSGEAAVVAQETALLRQFGHKVSLYESSNWEISGLSGMRLAWQAFWNFRAYREVRRIVGQEGIEICHVHNTFPLLSPAVYYAARAGGAAVVQTLHNYRLLCPAATLYRGGRICTDCVGKPFALAAILHGCYRRSRSASALAAASTAFHRWLRTYERCVDVFIALNAHARQLYIQGGLPGERIVVKGNFLPAAPQNGRSPASYVLYAGRLSQEKGVRTLLRAWQQYRPPLPLKIVGDGPLLHEVLQAIRPDRVEYLGRASRAEVQELMAQAFLVVVPSEWYEPFPVVVMEALAAGTPVLATPNGGLATLIEDGKTGLFFEPGNAASLAQRVIWAAQHPDDVVAMRQNALEAARRWTDPARAHTELLQVYQLALARARRRLRVPQAGELGQRVRL